MIGISASKPRDSCVKDLRHSSAMPCKLASPTAPIVGGRTYFSSLQSKKMVARTLNTLMNRA